MAAHTASDRVTDEGVDAFQLFRAQFERLHARPF